MASNSVSCKRTYYLYLTFILHPILCPKKAFTLVELMIVIAIIGILAAALFPSMSNYLARARDTQRVMDMSKMTVPSEQYMVDFGRYPIDGLWVDTSCGGSITTSLAFDGTFTCENSVTMGTGGWATGVDPKKNFIAFRSYIDKLPVDPVNRNDFFYVYEPVNANEENCISVSCRYMMMIHLENIRAPTVGSSFVLTYISRGWYSGSYGLKQR